MRLSVRIFNILRGMEIVIFLICLFFLSCLAYGLIYSSFYLVMRYLIFFVNKLRLDYIVDVGIDRKFV